MTINSSVNFLVYCIFGNKFKQMFMQIFCGRKPRLQAVHRGLELRRSQMDTVSYRWEDWFFINDQSYFGGYCAIKGVRERKSATLIILRWFLRGRASCITY